MWSAADFRSAIVVGCPPAYRGGTTKGTDLEIHLIKLFPQTAYFIEKVCAMLHVMSKLMNAACGNGDRRGSKASHPTAHQERQYRLGRLHAEISAMRSEDEANHT